MPCSSVPYVGPPDCPPFVKHNIASRADPGAAAMLKCDALGLKSAEAQRLCVLREIDRLSIDSTLVAPAAPIQLLPYPYPPLAPGGSANPYGIQIIR